MREPTSGVVIGQVTSNDPNGEGKIEVRFPWLGESSEPRWCSVASPMAGADRGIYFMPEVGDEVLVAFDHGDFDHGYVIGFTWNPVNRPPSNSSDQRIIKSREGHTIRFLDSESVGGNHGALIIEDAHGNAITMTNGVITIFSRGHLDIRASTMTIMNRVVSPLGGVI
jgi:phage baseplate assembly protein V